MNFQQSIQDDLGRNYADDRSERVQRDDECCRATFIPRAEEAVAALNKLAASAQDELVRTSKRALLTAVCLIYGAIRKIKDNASGAEYLASRNVSPHGNTDNWCQPYVKAFTQGTGSWARSAICKYGQVVAVGIHHNVPAEQFENWLSTRTIGQARAEYQSIVRERRKGERNAKLRKILIDPEEEPEKAPLMSATPLTIGHVGSKLAVLDLVADGSGKFRVTGILPYAGKAVTDIVMTAAEEAYASPGDG
jgi:hypothetical protein